jgi:DNA-binding HxlR family transcriptional regulator
MGEHLETESLAEQDEPSLAQSSKGPPAEATLRLLRGRWRLGLIETLAAHGTLRFSELRRQLPEIRFQVLAVQLREMERDGLVHRSVFGGRAQRVEYSLTRLGQSLRPVLRALAEWGAEHAVLGVASGPASMGAESTSPVRT